MVARASAALAAALVLMTGGCDAAPAEAPSGAAASLGLMSSLPIYWGEAADVGEMVAGDAKPGWVRQALERRYALTPLDTLDAAALAGLRHVLLAQPRVLTPAENVALDAWVRGGGRLLLFADPMLTRHSRYPIGDRRRPQDVILISPLLGHWGLDLAFDERQADGERGVPLQAGGPVLPVDLAGTLSAQPGSGCDVAAEGILAKCRIGKGRVVIVADAAVLDDPDDEAGADREASLAALLAAAFD